jgi:hypothetical protein
MTCSVCSFMLILPLLSCAGVVENTSATFDVQAPPQGVSQDSLDRGDGKRLIGMLGAGCSKGDGPSSAKRRQRRAANQKAEPVAMHLVRPPPFDANFSVTRKMRFGCSSSAALQPITAATLCEAFGMVCIAQNATAVPVWGFFRIKKVEMWGTTPGPGSTTSIAITWGYQNSLSAPLFGTNREVQDTSTSSAYTPHFSAVPPQGSNASLWQARLDSSGVRRTGNPNVMFSLLPTLGGIVDVTLELVAYDAGKSIAIPVTVINTGVAGAYAYAPIDGIAGYFVPVGVDQFT